MVGKENPAFLGARGLSYYRYRLTVPLYTLTFLGSYLFKKAFPISFYMVTRHIIRISLRLEPKWRKEKAQGLIR